MYTLNTLILPSIVLFQTRNVSFPLEFTGILSLQANVQVAQRGLQFFVWNFQCGQTDCERDFIQIRVPHNLQ